LGPSSPGGSAPISEDSVAEPLAVTWAGHATALIELDGVRLLSDPVLRDHIGPLRRIASAVSPRVSAAIDVVMLSHLHADHAELPSLRRLGASSVVLAPFGAGRWLRRHGVQHVEELSPGEEVQLGRVRIVATPARHERRRRPLGVQADPIGFLARGSQALYFAGDTDLFDEMSKLAGCVDLALLPIAGWGPTVGAGHLDPQRAVRAAARIAPRAVVPIHWGTFALPWPAARGHDPSRPAREFSALMTNELPDVEVRVLAPGERTVLARRGHLTQCPGTRLP
jgi:L-ascorbate metabolism protein UlaG (beta-lactamase superfamily)